MDKVVAEESALVSHSCSGCGTSFHTRRTSMAETRRVMQDAGWFVDHDGATELCPACRHASSVRQVTVSDEVEDKAALVRVVLLTGRLVGEGLLPPVYADMMAIVAGACLMPLELGQAAHVMHAVRKLSQEERDDGNEDE